MIRHAVTSEPENSAYLDSLGWVLYKRGQFEEARAHLDAAVKHIDRPDPVVLDHLGDVLYRLNQREQAVKNWKLTATRMGESGPRRVRLKTHKAQISPENK